MARFDYSFPYPSQRMPVLARQVMATSQPLAAQAGLEMLRRGGNAVDAALAAAITLTVVEPTSNGLGSDAFALLWHEGKLHGFNGSGRSPLALGPDRFHGLAEMPHLGWDSVTVPGAVSAWMTLSERFGRLAFDSLFDPAIEYASDGFLVSPLTAAAWTHAEQRFAAFPEFQRTFLPGGRAPGPGELFVSTAHADTLEQLADSGGSAFYDGVIAEQIAADAAAQNGLMTLEDLAVHSCDEVEPISIDYRGLVLNEIPPNGQGLAALIALGILSHHDVSTFAPDSADALHLQIEAMKLAFSDAHRRIADPAAMPIAAESLLTPAYLEERAAQIDLKRAKDPGYGIPRYSSTVYLAAADDAGQMVSFIQSNFEGFGSGIVIPGTGIAMQNRGVGFTLEEGHPNQVGGGKRPFHTIIPGFVTRRVHEVGGQASDEPVMAFGVMGGPMQPQGHVQVMIRLADFHQNPQAALDAPRWRVDGGLRVVLEPGFEPAVCEALRDRGHDMTIAEAKTVQHGGGQAVYRLPDGYCAASDLRRDGQAVGI